MGSVITDAVSKVAIIGLPVVLVTIMVIIVISTIDRRDRPRPPGGHTSESPPKANRQKRE